MILRQMTMTDKRGILELFVRFRHKSPPAIFFVRIKQWSRWTCHVLFGYLQNMIGGFWSDDNSTLLGIHCLVFELTNFRFWHFW